MEAKIKQELKIKQIEKILTRELKKKFDETSPRKFDKIHIFAKPFRNPHLKKLWNHLYGPRIQLHKIAPPLQPEIDMILCKNDKMIAVELKYFEPRGESLSRSFYEGIGQTLALLRWGFDNVALWQLYETSTSPEALWFYGGYTWQFLHGSSDQGGLGLPIEFTFMRIGRTNEGYEFRPIQPRLIDNAIRLDLLLPPYHPNFEIRAPHPNPLLRDPRIQELRNGLINWLRKRERK